jgi:hypothetical protein
MNKVSNNGLGCLTPWERRIVCLYWVNHCRYRSVMGLS